MCRIVGYLGEPVTLGALLVSPPHSLRQQAKSPRELPPGVIGSDGFGVGWFADGVASPARYRSVLPIWTDENVDTMAEHVRSRVIVASSRTASPRMPLALPNTPPFVAGAALLVHNGAVERFEEAALDHVRAELSSAGRAAIVGNTDSEYLTKLLSEQPSGSLFQRVVSLLGQVRRSVEVARTSAQLNLIVAEANELVAVRHALAANAPSLYVRHDARAFTAASEPLSQGPEWRALAPGDVIRVTTDARGLHVEWSRLEEAGRELR